MLESLVSLLSREDKYIDIVQIDWDDITSPILYIEFVSTIIFAIRIHPDNYRCPDGITAFGFDERNAWDKFLKPEETS